MHFSVSPAVLEVIKILTEYARIVTGSPHLVALYEEAYCVFGKISSVAVWVPIVC
jgi:hypothetical protein